MHHLIAGPVVVRFLDPVDDRVPHGDIGRGHVDLGPEHMGPFLELSGPHALEQIQVLFHGPVAIGAFLARFGQGAPVLPDLIGAQIADKGLALLDQLHGILVQLFIVIRGIIETILPVKSQPFYVPDDRIHIFLVFSARVRIVHAQIAGAAILGGDAEIEADGLGMSDMGVSVRFGGKPGGHTALVFVGSSGLPR